MSELNIIAFTLGERCEVTEKAIAFFPTRYMTQEGNLYKNGELNNIGRELDQEKLDDVHNILHDVCKYKIGTNSYMNLNSEQRTELLSRFEGIHPFCFDGIKELESDNFEAGILVLTSNSPVSSAAEAYWKLFSISQREKTPHSYDLNGAFGTLDNIAWMDDGTVVLAEKANIYQHEMRLAGEIVSPDSIDKFPCMTRYITPTGVRIADASRVRLGAYIGEGTTVMHEGFVNFNAGTHGKSMIEGRISAGVMVGKGSDLGGGCSTMGTLSGGGNIVIAVGENSLIGANAGIGIPLGNRCKVEAGLYITAGTKVAIFDADNVNIGTIKASGLANENDLLLRRNSTNGQVEAITNKTMTELNEALHKNN